jgi:restriction system protein
MPDFSPPNIRFVGRESELSRLGEMVGESPGVAVTGPAGSGKTALLSEFMRRNRQRFPGGVTYLTGRDSQLRELPAILGPANPNRRLLVIDEADASSERALVAYLREALERPDIHVILSSRRRFGRVFGLSYLELGLMSDAETRALAALYGLSPEAETVLSQQARGHPLVARLLAEHAGAWGEAALLGKLGKEFLPTILGADGRPLKSSDQELGRVEATVRGISDSLIEALAQRPEIMYEISPRRFEELVAELYHRDGYEVELTPVSGDGGVDIYAVQKTPFGSFLTVVDCKRYRRDRPVGVGLIRQLYGTVEAKEASVGVLATTSTFTKGASEFQEARKYRLGLQDFLSIHELLLKQSRRPDLNRGPLHYE